MPNFTDHFLPKLLLRRFASRTVLCGKPKHHKYFIWQGQRGKIPLEKNIRDIEAQRNFYGENRQADQNLQAIETRFGEIVKKIIDGADPNVFATALERFAWSLALRTRNIEQQLAGATSTAFGLFLSEAQKNIPTQQLEKGIESRIAGLPPEKQQIAKAAFRNPEFKAKLLELAQVSVKGVFALAEGLLADPNVAAEEIRRALNEAFINPVYLKNPPLNFKVHKWEFITSEQPQFLLGDTGILALDEMQRHAHPLAMAGQWKCIIIPVSSEAMLIGSRDDFKIDWSASEMNRAIAKNSFAHIYASTPDLVAANSRYIGNSGGLLPDETIIALAREASRKFKNQTG